MVIMALPYTIVLSVVAILAVIYLLAKLPRGTVTVTHSRTVNYV